MTDIDPDRLDLSSIQPDLMTSGHYRKWHGQEVAKEKTTSYW